MPTLEPANLLETNSAAEAPWLGSVKHIWKTLGPDRARDSAEAEGVRLNMLSVVDSGATARAEPVVTWPAMTCMPQSFRAL